VISVVQQRPAWWSPTRASGGRTHIPGLAVRIAQRILALTIGMLLNPLSGRPALALAAYDGR